MSIFPGTGSQNEFFPYVPPAAFSNGELEGRSPPGCYTHTVILYYSISRYTGYIRMTGPSVFPDTRVLKMLGPSVFPDSWVKKSSFGTQNGLFGTDFKSETTSKYILDIP